MQIVNHPVLKKKFKQQITFHFNDKPLTCRKGQTIAAALMANGIKKFGVNRKSQEPRGMFCSSGRCCSCFVTVNDLEHVLSCMTRMKEGMNIYSSDQDPDLRSDK